MNTKSVSNEDLALFAMQLLTPEEHAEIVTHLEHNEAARQELAQLQGELAIYALTSELHSPPAMARDRLMRRVAKEKKLIPISRPVPVAGAVANEEPLLVPRGGRLFQMEEETPRRSAGFATWAGWAIAAGLGVAAGLQFHQKQVLQDSYNSQSAKLTETSAQASKADQVMQALSGAGAMEVDMHLPAGAAATVEAPNGHAAYVAETGSLVFVGTHLAPLQAYKTYELWVIPADKRDPIPAGTFKPDERGFASVILPELPKGVAAGSFGITIEDDGGSKQGPTMPIVLAGL